MNLRESSVALATIPTPKPLLGFRATPQALNPTPPSLVALVCLILLELGMALAFADDRASLKEIAVNSDVIKLSDIARSEDVKLQAQLDNVVLGYAPHPGLKRTFKKAEILAAARASGLDAAWLEAVVPEGVTVARASQLLKRHQVERLVLDHLSRLAADSSKKIVVKEVRFPEVWLPLGQIQMRLISWPSRLTPKLTFSVDLRVDGKRVRTIFIESIVEVWGEVPYSSGPIKRGQALRSEDLIWRRENLATLPGDAITDRSQVEGKVARSDIGCGRLIRYGLIEAPRLVNRGDIVRLMVAGDRFKISAKARAKAPGRFGDLIPVVNLDSQKTVLARVTGEGEVTVKF